MAKTNPNLEAEVLKAPARPRYTFTIPPASRTFADDPSTITLVPITVAEEQLAAKASGGGPKMGEELLKLALVAADGRELSWAEGQRDELISKVSPKVRQLMYTAFGELHNPKDEDKADFLASAKVALR